jgi:hypothetical protein
MPIFSPQQIADIILQRPGRITANMPPVPRRIFGIPPRISAAFGMARLACRPANMWEELQSLGFSETVIGAFKDARIRAVERTVCGEETSHDTITGERAYDLIGQGFYEDCEIDKRALLLVLCAMAEENPEIFNTNSPPPTAAFSAMERALS